MDNSIIVTVCCLTYNHEKFIRQCLDGFIMQKTSFRFEVLVHDDASTDKTQDIIREYESNYPNIIRPIFQKKNQYSKGIRAILATFCYPHARGKYIAICEGDDYWIDPLKLQKHVDFLENNPEYGLVYTFSKIYNHKKGCMEENLFGSEYKGYDDLLAYNRISTLTTCARKEAIIAYIEDIKPQKRNWLMGDYPMWLWIGYHYKIKFFPDITSVYRVLEESASHSQDIKKNERFILSTIDIMTFFHKKFNISPTNLYYHAVNEYYYNLFSQYKDARNYSKAKHYADIINPKHISAHSRTMIRKFKLEYIKVRLLNLLLHKKIN